MIKAVLFDLDGTFADTAPDLAAALNYVRGLYLLKPLPLEILRPQASHGSAGLLGVGFLNMTPEHSRFNVLRDEFLAYYSEHICEYTTLFSGMSQLIDFIEQQGLLWGIVTNKPHRFTVPLMQALGYDKRASCLVSGDTCPQAKPHPLPLLHAAELLGVAPEQCLYLGDDKRDMEAANAANMRGIIALYGYIDTQAVLADWQAFGEIQNPLGLQDYIKS